MKFLPFFRLAALGTGLLLPACPGPAQAADQVEGWGTASYSGPGDLQKAIEASKDSARLDLSANILTYVNVKTEDSTVQTGDKVEERFSRVTVTRVVQLLREVHLDEPQVDEKDHLVKTRASVSGDTARQIVQDCLARLQRKREEYQKNRDFVQRITGRGLYYYKTKTLKLPDPKDEDRLNQEMTRLKADLIEDQLKDIQDVRNAVKTVALKDFPEEDQTTFLAYIGIHEYELIVDNYDSEMNRARSDARGQTYGSYWVPGNHEDHARVASADLPAKVYDNFAWAFDYTYVGGVDPEFDLQLDGLFMHAWDHWGLRASLGVGFGMGGNQITNAAAVTAAGYTEPFSWHFPLEADGLLYLSRVETDKDIPFLKAGLLCALSWADAKNPDTNAEVDFGTHFTTGECLGVGMTLFRKQSGVFLKTFDFGLDCKLINGGFYGEGQQTSVGAYTVFGV